jgi:hypothetical protein
MTRMKPLSALLSHVLVAFIMEFDNEFEQQTPHRTSTHGGSANYPWLVSMVMWTKFLQFVPKEGISVTELQHATGVSRKSLNTWLVRLGKWWGYISMESNRVHLMAGGRAAIATWRPLTVQIETRWQTRFGKRDVDRLRQRVQTVATQLSPDLPSHLPILGYGLFNDISDYERRHPHADSTTLPALLSKVLLAFATEFEQKSGMSLAVCANVLRLLNAEGVPVRDLPRLSGIAKEAIAVALNLLEKSDCAVIPKSKMKIAALTGKGQKAQDEYHHHLAATELSWQARFGKDTIDALRESLEGLADQAVLIPKPYPDGWRAALPTPEVLPDFPVISHRGGFPDGS